MGTGPDIPADHVGLVLEGIDDALTEAESAGDDRAVANLLAAGAHAALRRGDARAAHHFGERAAKTRFHNRTAQYDAVRAQGFAATAAGDLEAALNQTIKARVIARDSGRNHDLADQSCTLAALYLALGAPDEARSCADAALMAARIETMHDVEAVAGAWRASADGEAGLLDRAAAALAEIATKDLGVVAQVDVACARAYWLLERGAAGDARTAEGVATAALAAAIRAGVDHRATALHASVARAAARQGDDARAREELERARRSSDRAEPQSLSLLALAASEVLTSADSQRHVMLSAARARILRTASRREDPRSYCTAVRLNRRLLELTGGIPSDLPGPA
ncbi:MAG TPA: hypothetical protein VM261_07795 [Kofleriaceae bacterium]|nr:hypothetical protein [Kofleriaceae bacterium]